MGTKEGEKQKYRDGKIKKIYIDKDRPTQGEKERLQRQIQSQKERGQRQVQEIQTDRREQLDVTKIEKDKCTDDKDR